jgi:3-dehydroquinate synthetase
VPTSLLAQVDAAIGGKTGVNLERGKNLVGTIYQPNAVICDVSLLASCPEAEMRSGMAEVIKYGFIADPDLLDVVVRDRVAIEARDEAVLVDLVARCVAIKASIVASDERETGERAFLNYGHTYAHGIEAAAGFSGIRHGEAVAIGMMAAALTAQELGRIEDDVVELHRRTLRAFDLPVGAELDLARLEQAWMNDKKYQGGVRFVLLMGVGKPEAGIEVPRAVLGNVIDRLAAEEGAR